MRILINYDPNEKGYLGGLQFFMRKYKLEAIATSTTLTISQLLDKALSSKCEAILLCNPETLKNLVPDSSKTSLDLYRGSRFNYSVPVVVCNSLTHIHSVPYGSFLLETDLKKLFSLEEKTDFSFTVLENIFDFAEAEAILKSATLIAYDIETKTTKENETLITCCSWTAVLPSLKLHTYVLPLIDFNENHFTSLSDYAEAISFLRRINALPIPKVMHNGMYDALHSLTYHAPPYNFILDTMALAWSQYSSLPKSLDFVASITLPDYIQWKTQAAEASAKKDIQSYWAYNAKDTFYTARIALHYLYNLPAYARKNYQIQFPLVYPFLYTAFEGILVDNEKREKLKEKAQNILEENLRRLQTCLANKDFNPSSPKQVSTYIYDILGGADPHIGKQVRQGKKVTSSKGTDTKNLTAIGQQHPILLRVTSAIISYREERKAIGTYFEFQLKNNRLLYNINPFGTETGRASASSSSFWCGTQVQNIPPYAKKMLVADEGFTMFEVDNSQSEARCVAYLSGDTALIAALEDKERDFYTTLGTLFFGIPYENVTKEFRNKVLKKIVHGTNYMMGEATFVENATPENIIFAAQTLGVKITLSPKPKEGEVPLKKFAGSLLESYHKPFNKVREWHNQVKLDIATTHMLVSPLKFTRYFFGDITKDHAMMRGAVAHGPQNLSVSILNIGLWEVWKLVKKEKGALRLKAQIHDSILAQYKDGREDLKHKVISLLERDVLVNGRTLRIPVDSKEGKSWGEME